MNNKQIIKLLELQVLGMGPINRSRVKVHLDYIKRIAELQNNTQYSMVDELYKYISQLEMNRHIKQDKNLEYEISWLTKVYDLFKAFS